MSHPIRDQQGLYFLTFTVVNWVDIFTRPVYKDLLIDSLRYCQQHKGLELFAYCLMTNHLHLIARAANGHELSAIVRDFKKFTARAVFKEMTQLPTESRRQWLRWLLTQESERNPNTRIFSFGSSAATAWNCATRKWCASACTTRTKTRCGRATATKRRITCIRAPRFTRAWRQCCP